MTLRQSSQWVLRCRSANTGSAAALPATLNPILDQILRSREMDSPAAIDTYLHPSLKAILDPAQLPDIAKAVERLFKVRAAEESLVLFGDYDVDGITATALLAGSMRSLGWKVHTYLPHRMEDGYGVNPESISKCLKRFPVGLWVVIDSGSAAAASVEVLNRQQVDVIILDHHEIGQPPPMPFAFINPKCSEDCPTELRDLCSVGLAFKLLHALVKEGRERQIESFIKYDIRVQLDLVALGCIADLVPLTGENRILTASGLKRMNPPVRLGIKELLASADIQPPLTAATVAFQISPRLNAAGRLGDAHMALDLLLSDDTTEARRLAAALDRINLERRTLESTIAAEATAIAQGDYPHEENPILVLANLNWHIGVVGIVASRIQRMFGRPAIVLGSHKGELRGSGRSVPGFDLLGAVQSCRHYLIRSGGHAMAVGLSLAPEQLDAFRKAINDPLHRLSPADKAMATIEYDAEVQIDQLTAANVEGLGLLEPTGQGNPPPRLLIARARMKGSARRAGKTAQHAFFTVADGKAIAEAVYWNCPEDQFPTGEFDLLVEPEFNHYRGQRTVQLKVLDWRSAQ